MYTLIGKPTNRAFRALWMLEELEVEYEIIPAAPRSKELLAFNPSGKSPVLKTGDDIIIDSFAIIQYLADKHQRFSAPPGTIHRAVQDSMSAFALDEIDGVLWNLAKHKFVLPEELRQPETRAASEYEFNRSMQWLEQRIGEHEYACGDEFSVPDILIGHCAGWARAAKLNWPEGKLSDYVSRLTSRSGYQRAHEIRTDF